MVRGRKPFVSRTGRDWTKVFSGWVMMAALLLSLAACLDQDFQEREKDQALPPTQTVVSQTPRVIVITATPSFTTTPTTTQQPTVLPAGSREKARVVKVIDGDTIRVILHGEELPVRYIGVDTLEVQYDEWMGEEAYLANLALVGGREVYLEKDVSETDRYGRLLRYVYLLDGTFVNADLVRNGWAAAVAYPPDTKHQDLFRDLERQARSKSLGRWQTTPTPGVPAGSDGDVRIISVDKRAEVVEIQNTGTKTISLEGWLLLSERGHQDCPLAGELLPGETLKIWAMENDHAEGGFNCGYDSNIWNNSKTDPAVLFNAQGQEVDRYP